APRVFLIAHSDRGVVHQEQNRCGGSLQRWFGLGDLLHQLSAKPRQGFAKAHQLPILLLSGHLLPARVIDVLLAAQVVASGCLNVSAVAATDPNVLPSRRDGQPFDTFQDGGGADRAAIEIAVSEAAPTATALNALVQVADIDQTRAPSGTAADLFLC